MMLEYDTTVLVVTDEKEHYRDFIDGLVDAITDVNETFEWIRRRFESIAFRQRDVQFKAIPAHTASTRARIYDPKETNYIDLSEGPTPEVLEGFRKFPSTHAEIIDRLLEIPIGEEKASE